MKLLLHICCGPCAVFPVRVLRRDAVEVMGFFYPHNIHPYSECLRRRDTLRDYADRIGLKVIFQKGYDLEGFLRSVAHREANRCTYCYHDRLRATALTARRGRFDGFTTTLLYSKFQKHELIKSIGEAVGRSVGVPFVYHDFRPGWKEGIDESKQLGLYRQAYCGCIYSEKERFYRSGRTPAKGEDIDQPQAQPGAKT